MAPLCIAAASSYAATVGQDASEVDAPKGDGVFYRNSKTRIGDITDGTSQTVLIGDRAWVREANGRLVVQFAALPRAAQAAIGVASRARYGALRARARYREVRQPHF